jgi:hypothetical protein
MDFQPIGPGNPRIKHLLAFRTIQLPTPNSYSWLRVCEQITLVLRHALHIEAFAPSLNFDQVTEAANWLDERDFRVFIADTDNSINYRRANFSGRTAIVIGSERYGVII